MCRCRLAAAVQGPPPRPREKDDCNGQCLFIDGGQSEQEVKKGGWRGGAGGGWTERIQRENKQRSAKRRANKDTSDTSGVYVPAVQTQYKECCTKSLQFPEGILSNGRASRLNCYSFKRVFGPAESDRTFVPTIVTKKDVKHYDVDPDPALDWLVEMFGK